jgi:hypothetical protein
MITALSNVLSLGSFLALIAVGLLPVARRHTAARLICIAAALLLLVIRTSHFVFLVNGPYSIDLEIFRAAGRAVLTGANPYDPSPEIKMVSPPTALPLFTGLALLPGKWAAILLGVVNIIGAFALVPLSWIALGGRKGPAKEISWIELAVIGIAVGVSDSAITNQNLGQLSVIIALAVVGAFALEISGRAFSAGVALALATIKVTTLIPILTIVPNKRRIEPRLVAGLIVGVVILSVAVVHPSRVLLLYVADLQKIHQLTSAGEVNDYTFSGPETGNIISLRHAFYRVGIVNGNILAIVDGLLLSFAGASLMWASWRGKLPRAGLLALVCLYSVVFIYHRAYDLVLLALPLVYAFALISENVGTVRRLAYGSMLSMVLALYLRAVGMSAISRQWHESSWPVRALIMPSITWLILAAASMLFFAIAISDGAGQICEPGLSKSNAGKARSV